VSREEELLELIASAPDDDAHRLVYADLLSERGDPRGEFIALQLQREGTPEQKERERALLRDHSEEWLGPLARVIESCTFERGFLHACTVRFGSAHEMEEAAPSPLWATVERLAGQVQFAGMGAFRALRTLGPASFEDLEKLWRHAALPSITEVMTEVHALTPDDARFLGDARPFPRLKNLGLIAPDRFEPLGHDLLSPHTIRFLLAGRRARKLEKLAIRARATYTRAAAGDALPRPELLAWWELVREVDLPELWLEPSHGIRHRFFRERDAWSLEIHWRTEFATGDPAEIERSLRGVPDHAFHRVVVRQLGVPMPHHRDQITRVLGRFPRLVIQSAE
jgi:uncharacterized protein (TIGR02996 family)